MSKSAGIFIVIIVLLIIVGTIAILQRDSINEALISNNYDDLATTTVAGQVSATTTATSTATVARTSPTPRATVARSTPRPTASPSPVVNRTTPGAPATGGSVIVSSNTYVSPDGPTGAVTGTVVLDPICPGMRLPYDSSCAPRPYRTQISVRLRDSNRIIATVTSDVQGRFIFHLPAGIYEFLGRGGNPWPICSVETVEVKVGVGTSPDMECDTGIR
jgi:hypothetical protein